jgi:hypothetical protein
MSEDEFKKGMLEDIEKVWIDGAKAVIGQTLGGAAGATVGLAVPIPGAAFALGILGGVAGDAVAKLIPTEFIQKILPDSLKNFFSEGIYDMMFNGDPRKFRSMLRELELKGNIIKLEMAQKKNADDLSKRLREVAGEGKTGLAALEDTRLKELEQEGADVQERLDKARTQLTVLEKVSEGVSYEQLARRELGLKDSPIAGASKAVNESVAKRAAEIRERTQKAIDASQGEVFINPPITTNAPPPNVTNTVIPGQQQQVQQPAQQQPSIETRNPDRTLDQSRNQTHFYNESGSSFAIAAP